MVTAAKADRPALLAALAMMAARAARQLVAVTTAMEDQSRPLSRGLLSPLPGANAWVELVQRVATEPPEAVARDVGLGEPGVVHFERLRALGDLSWVTALVELSEQDGVLVAETSEWRHSEASVLVIVDGTVRVTLREEDAANVADTTAELVAVARGLLGSYLHGGGEAQS